MYLCNGPVYTQRGNANMYTDNITINIITINNYIQYYNLSYLWGLSGESSSSVASCVSASSVHLSGSSSSK